MKFGVQLFKLIAMSGLVGWHSLIIAQTKPVAIDNPWCVVRYEQGSSLFRVQEDLQKLFAVDSTFEDPRIAIRICSAQPLSQSFASATVSPLQLTDFLMTRAGYGRSSIALLRSSECPNQHTSAFNPTEIWSIRGDAKPLASEESYSYANVEFGSFGFDPTRCQGSPFDSDVKRFVSRMKTGKTYGAIVGYFWKKPSKRLKSRVRAALRMVVARGVERSRITVAYQAWHDGDSACIGVEPDRPMLLTMTVER